jgi:tetratricopeptide (TPR) repeat protein
MNEFVPLNILIRQQVKKFFADIATGVTSRKDRWLPPLICVALAAITFVVFGQTVGFQFINFDDNTYIYDNALVKGGLSWGGVKEVFTHFECSLYHPLTMLSLMANDQWFGLQPGGYHLTNVFFHAGSVVLLFLVLRAMAGGTWAPAFVAAVFAIHPLRVESVAWVSERKDVLSVFFFMTTLAAYVHYVRKPEARGRFAIVAGSFALALLCKPTVVTLPFVLLLLDYWPLRRFENPRRVILEKIPLLALAAAACIVTMFAVHEDVNQSPHGSLFTRLGSALVYYVVYLKQMVWPVGLATPYPETWPEVSMGMMALSGVLLAAISFAAWKERRRRPWLLVGWLWYLGMFVPMIGIQPLGSFPVADRYTYLPQIGIYIALAWLATGLRLYRFIYAGLICGIVAALTVCAWKQTGYWADNETLWAHTLKCTERNWSAQFALGMALDWDGNDDEAMIHYRKALEIKPDYAQAEAGIGNVLLRKGKVDEAIAHYQKAIQLKSDYTGVYNTLAGVFQSQSRLDDAIAGYKKALEIAPSYAEAHYGLGNVYGQMGKLDAAIGEYQQAVKLNPDYAAAQYNLAGLLLQKGEMDEAAAHFQKAVDISPKDAGIHQNFGLCLYQAGRMAEAISQYEQGLAMAPLDAGIQNNLAWILATCPDASVRDGNRAVDLASQASAAADGNNPAFLCTLAAAQAETGKFADAASTAERALHLAEAQTNSNLAGELQSQIKLYSAGQPFHITAPSH